MRTPLTIPTTGARVILADSIAEIGAEDAGAIVVCASHGGVSAGRYASAVALAAVFFNDAGVGKDQAGIAALSLLQDAGVAAGTVSHHSARIGEAQDTWASGVISYLNPAAREAGFEVSVALQAAIRKVFGR